MFTRRLHPRRRSARGENESDVGAVIELNDEVTEQCGEPMRAVSGCKLLGFFLVRDAKLLLVNKNNKTKKETI